MLIRSPVRLIVVGFLMLLVGVVVPVLMMVDVIRTTLLLSFLSHAASFGGLILGTIGIMMASIPRRDPSKQDGYPFYDESEPPRYRGLLGTLWRSNRSSDRDEPTRDM